jgi:hypothetical protein
MKGAYIPALKKLFTMASTSFSLTMQRVQTDRQDHADLVKHLQFLDILSQRIEHLIKAHESIMTLYVDELFKRSFLHLQYYQFEVVGYDLLHSLSEIQTYVKINFPDGGLIVFFESKPSVMEQVETIRQIIKEEAGLPALVGMRPLTSQQISTCSQLYTMASERIVMDWFLATRMNKDTQQLLAYYQERIKNDNNNGSELF